MKILCRRIEFVSFVIRLAYGVGQGDTWSTLPVGVPVLLTNVPALSA